MLYVGFPVRNGKRKFHFSN
uniref:Uncharacterized protein n=1 Tax=Arundo donax TaxID=35708 RepID=A0A0A9ETU5_ARUDO